MYSNSGANKPRRGLFNRHYYRAFCPEMQLQNGYMKALYTGGLSRYDK